MRNLCKSVMLLGVMLAVVLVSGCATSQHQSNSILPDTLASNNIHVSEKNNEGRVIIPSSQIFNGQSANLTKSASYYLKLVANYLKQKNKVATNVSAMVYGSMSKNIKRAIAQKQAEAMAKYFSDVGINSQIITTGENNHAQVSQKGSSRHEMVVVSYELA